MKKLIHQRNPCQSLEDGYALIESLIAIVVVTILLTAVTPMIVFSAGTRMQAKRIQLATQAARSYLSELKAKPLEIAPSTDETIPTAGELSGDCESADGYCSYDPDTPTTGRRLYCVNFDETDGCQTNSMVDMVVWPVREPYENLDTGEDLPARNGYKLELRVYRANSFADGVGALQRDGTDNSVAQALGNRTLPLFQTATAISDRNNTDLYRSLCDNFGGCE